MKFVRLIPITIAVLICTVYAFGTGFVGRTDNGQAFGQIINEEYSENPTESENIVETDVVTEKTNELEQAQSPANTVTNETTKSEIPMLPILNSDTVSDNIFDSAVPSLIDVPAVVIPTTPSTTQSSPTSSEATSSSSTETPKPSTTTSKVTSTTTKATTTTTKPATTSTTTKATTTTTKATTTTTKATTTTTVAQTGWSGTLTVKNNLSSSSSYGQTVTQDAYTIVCRNVEAEMGSSYHAEALKAQALAAYSYIKTHNGSSLPLADNVSEAVKKAVSAVNGYAVLYNGSYTQTFYSASSGGNTANSSEVWGGASIPYLISVPCPVDAQYSPNYGVTTTYSSSQIAQYVKSATGVELSGDPSGWFNLTRSSSGYVNYVDIGGKGRITGLQFRSNVMQYKIKSHNFKISYSANSDLFTITTYGYGHGVGMSQSGANYYAKYYGWNYQQIIYHFYPGVSISRVV